MTELSRTSSDLRVLARNTTFQYKGKAVDVTKLGHDLGVRYVLEGSIRRSDDRVRVMAQLIDTQTGAHVWADRFDREMADIFLVQDEIVSQIVAKIAGNYGVIEITEAKSATRKNPREIQAYDLILRAQDVMRPEWSHETFSAAKDLLRQAIALDQLNARARRELAYLAVIGWVFRFDDPPSRRKRSRRKRPRRFNSTPPMHGRIWWPRQPTFSPSSSICSSARPSRRSSLRPMTPRSWPLSPA